MHIPDELYRQILPVLPIACVDLLVVDRKRVLLLKRRNEPAKGLWWLPGGRVHFGELRSAAAVRKLREECGLTVGGGAPLELSTEDLILPDGRGGNSHVIATVFRIDVDAGLPVVLDAQSEAAAWRTAQEWAGLGVHPYILHCLNKLTS